MPFRHPVLKAKRWNGEDFRWSQRKLDGHRATLFEDRLLTDKLDLTEYIKLPRIPPKSSIDGEIVWPGHTAAEVPTALRNGQAKFIAFAVPWWKGSFLEDADLDFVNVLLRNEGFQRAETFIGNAEWTAKSEGWEGLVFKMANYRGWYKLKFEWTVDVVITGLKDGVGLHSGLIGSVSVAVWKGKELLEIGWASGFDEDQRSELSESDIGRVIEVKCQGIIRDRLRHPRFVRWRDDKEASECTVSATCRELGFTSTSQIPSGWRT